MAPSEKTWGVTPPVSEVLPTMADTQASTDLLEELKRQGNFESPLDTQKRKLILTSLQRIVDEFVRRVAREKEPNNTVLVRDARGEVFTFGSYCLGVYGPGSDIDTLVCAPKYVARDDFFRLFPDLLKEMAPKGAITGLTSVADAFVPIIKLEYLEISIDLIFSKIAVLNQFPPHGQLHLTDNQYLRGLEDIDLRCLNGTRVTTEILNVVPEQSVFRLALRAIKLWAQRRAIYANIVGFPGGVVWAMLVARVCQLYPRAAGATIVNRFFTIIRQWPWPLPVQLKPMDTGPLNVRVWNPKVYKSDSFHLMPVITPAYPEMCATYNITHSNMAILKRELDRGIQIVDKIATGGAPWKSLFVKHQFFTAGYKYYLAVNIVSTTKEAHKVWSGFVESKVRMLVAGLERHASISIAHPFNKGFPRSHRIKSDDEFTAVLDGTLDYVDNTPEAGPEEADSPASADLAGQMKSDVDQEQQGQAENGHGKKPEMVCPKLENEKHAGSASPNGSPGIKKEHDGLVNVTAAPAKGRKIYSTTHYIGLELAEGAKSLDLSYQVNEFRDICYQWDKYEKDMNFLSIQHVRSVNLPDDVFEPGETRPPRPRPLKKRLAPADGEASQAKRQHAGRRTSATTAAAA